LTGSLKDFGLTDLFQVLGQQQKTGVLNLQGDKDLVQVLFEKGMIVGVSVPDETGEDTALGKRLIRGGLISAENWEKALHQHKDGLMSIEKMLVTSGLITKEDLLAALRLLAVDTIYGIFKWKGGTFRFETKPVSYDHEFVEPMSSEYLLLDVLRMVDEWPMIAKRLPHFDVALQKVNPMATLDVLTGTPWENNRSFQMEVIYDLIDGQRSVKEIIDLSFVEEFETCKNLILLMDAGLVESSSVGMKTIMIKPHGPRLQKYLAEAGAYFIVGVIAFVLFFQFVVFWLPTFPFAHGGLEGWYVLQGSLEKVREAKLRNAREVFFWEEARYPKEPAEMMKSGLLNR
jgi:hypothetical protein